MPNQSDMHFAFAKQIGNEIIENIENKIMLSDMSALQKAQIKMQHLLDKNYKVKGKLIWFKDIKAEFERLELLSKDELIGELMSAFIKK